MLFHIAAQWLQSVSFRFLNPNEKFHWKPDTIYFFYLWQRLFLPESSYLFNLHRVIIISKWFYSIHTSRCCPTKSFTSAPWVGVSGWSWKVTEITGFSESPPDSNILLFVMYTSLITSHLCEWSVPIVTFRSKLYGLVTVQTNFIFCWRISSLWLYYLYDYILFIKRLNLMAGKQWFSYLCFYNFYIVKLWGDRNKSGFEYLLLKVNTKQTIIICPLLDDHDTYTTKHSR